MMVRIPIYKNSIGATILSFFGYAFFASGVISTVSEIINGGFGENIVAGIIIILCGIGLMFWAEATSKRKQFRTWKRKIREQGLADRIKDDVGVAVAVYNSNPGKKSLAFIAELNPAAGQLIQDLIRAKKEPK